MKKIVLIASLGIILITSSAFVLSSNGIVGETGSPGEGNCGGCHSGGAGATIINITASPAFTGNQYIPGQLYTVTLTVTNPNFSKFGFDCEILTSGNSNAGIMSGPQAGVKFVNSGARKNATHTTVKSGIGTVDFVFDWTAPASGNATFYTAANAVNGTGSTNGDRPANSALVLTDITTNLNEHPVTSVNFNVYPNPSANELNLQYNLANDANIEVALYDLNGKEINKVLGEQQSAGIHSVNADLSAISAGFYIIKLSVNGNISKQHIFIKR